MNSNSGRGGTGQLLGGREAVYRIELDGGPDAKKALGVGGPASC